MGHGDSISAAPGVVAELRVVEVRTLSGKLVAALAQDSPKETVGALRQRLLKSVHDDDLRRRYGQSWLVHGCSVLPDHRQLGDCLGSKPWEGASSAEPISLTLVCARPSSLAEHLSQAGLEEGGLVDVADAVFQAEHLSSMRYRPSVEDLASNLLPDLRAQVVNWLAISCNAVGLDDQILHGAVLTLDRYCALNDGPMDKSQLLRLSLAVLCTEMKLATNDDFPHGTWQRLILHLGQGRENLPDIFAAELQVFRQLGYSVCVPTTLTFLRGLGLRLCQGPGDGEKCIGPATPEAELQLAFAQFFVDMALFDVALQYRFPSAVLAAAALGAAQCAIGSADTAAHDVLLEDLASYCPDLPENRCLVEECELLLLEMWRDCAEGSSRWRDCYHHLRERHARPLQGLTRPSSAWADEAQDGVQSQPGQHSALEHLMEASPEAALHSLFVLRES